MADQQVEMYLYHVSTRRVLEQGVRAANRREWAGPGSAHLEEGPPARHSRAA